MAEQSLPTSMNELLSVIEHEWNLLMDVTARLDETEMTTPDSGGWSPKDNLAHLTEWMKILLGYHIDGHADYEVIGVSPEVTKDWDFNLINQVLFERNRGRTVEDVLGELKSVYAQVCDRLNSMPFEDLLRPRWSEEPDSPSLLVYVIANTSEHFAEHRETMEKALKK